MKKLSRTYNFFRVLPDRLRALRHDLETLSAKTDSINEEVSLTKNQVDEALNSFSNDLEYVKQAQADTSHKLAELGRSGKHVREASVALHNDKNLQADNHDLDNYYLAFEERFRGSEEEIYKRLKRAYGKQLATGVSPQLKKMPLVDIGCGRGELLKLAREAGLTGIGIDLNKAMVERCKKLGFEAVQQDALVYLKKQKPGSLSVVSGIHIVEHLPFDELITLLRECFRVIAPGGFVFFETPNPENLTVGATTFWYDSSHIKPVPPEVLAFVLGYVGFNDTKIQRMHPNPENSLEIRDGIIKKLVSKVFGPQDYAAFGYKSRAITTSKKS